MNNTSGVAASAFADIETVFRNLTRYAETTATNAKDALDEIGQLLTRAVQSEHAYKDQTGQLTASIAAFIDENTSEFVQLAFSATVDYARFVELCRGGKYAFLLPVVETHASEIRAIIERKLSA